MTATPAFLKLGWSGAQISLYSASRGILRLMAVDTPLSRIHPRAVVIAARYRLANRHLNSSAKE